MFLEKIHDDMLNRLAAYRTLFVRLLANHGGTLPAAALVDAAAGGGQQLSKMWCTLIAVRTHAAGATEECVAYFSVQHCFRPSGQPAAPRSAKATKSQHKPLQEHSQTSS